MSQDRRENFRVPNSRLITEIVNENPFAASVTNLSHCGMYTVKPVSSGLRGPRLVQLEIPVPEASETIWASGEIVYETRNARSIGAGIRFKAMANFHQRLLGELLEYQRHEIISKMMEEIKWRKQLDVNPSPFNVPSPHINQDTVKMYLMENKR